MKRLAVFAAALLLIAAGCSAREDGMPLPTEPAATAVSETTAPASTSVTTSTTSATTAASTTSTTSTTATSTTSATSVTSTTTAPSTTQTTQTRPPETKAPAPPATQPPATKPLAKATKPAAPVTAPPATKPVTTVPATKPAATKPAVTKPDTSYLKTYADQVIALVNKERAAQGLEPMYALPALNQAAIVRSGELVKSFSHTRPDGRPCYSILEDNGIAWMAVGENIAAGYSDPAEVMDGWMHSDGHRGNILGDFSYIGVGVVEQDGMLYWTQEFSSGSDPTGAYLPK